MNPIWFGDSYDIVKRFFCDALLSIGYTVYVDPMLTGEWSGNETEFYKLLGVRPVQANIADQQNSALFIDPDTGVSATTTKKHLSFDQLAHHAQQYGVVFAFDQSFSRSGSPKEQIQQKLGELRLRGCYGLYYDSHARFIFVSRTESQIQRLRDSLLKTGLPEPRLVLHH